MRFLMLLSVCLVAWSATARSEEMPGIVISGSSPTFIFESTNKTFTPWGFNYDHDSQGRLIEDYWDDEWEMVDSHFQKMSDLGANTVRIHLQLGKFMDYAEVPTQHSLEQLRRLLKLAESKNLYLDITGLGCYHKADVPEWYDKLNEQERWNVQAHFWQAVAVVGAESPAVFCYDLMNEPVVPGGQSKDWLGPPFAGKHFVQFISLDLQKRSRPEVARQWIRHLAAAIRSKDKRHLITVGLVDWSLDRPGLTSGFVPEKIVDELDFLCVHLYPERGKLNEAQATLKGFNLGKPVVIEETFPLKSSMSEFEQFIEQSKPHSAGFIGFFWGRTPNELKGSTKFEDAITREWLEYFQKNPAEIGR